MASPTWTDDSSAFFVTLIPGCRIGTVTSPQSETVPLAPPIESTPWAHASFLYDAPSPAVATCVQVRGLLSPAARLNGVVVSPVQPRSDGVTVSGVSPALWTVIV